MIRHRKCSISSMHAARCFMSRSLPTASYAHTFSVYEEAVAEAHYEGGISAKERALLDRLRDSLGISEVDAATIESDSKARLAGAA